MENFEIKRAKLQEVLNKFKKQSDREMQEMEDKLISLKKKIRDL